MASSSQTLSVGSTSSPTMENAPTSNTNFPFGNVFTQGMSIKLDENNFLLWKSIVISFVKGI
ncbi:hypothetical protein Sjap_021867 [Stephania japonica]|uniref:Retrotransposon Copia-like N-terminal domain-containing protein n=1 Tax=Stephania japonica TaxID=461633 RepID=A0AAP0EMU1_9MAGN